MTRRLFVLQLFLFFVIVSGFSQNKELTIEDATSRNPSLFPASLSQCQWLGNSGSFVYVKANALISGVPGSGKRDTILSLKELNEKLAELGTDGLKKFPLLSPMKDNCFYFTGNDKIWKLDPIAKKVWELNNTPKGAENLDIENSRFNIAYTKENNLFISVKGVETAISDEKNFGIKFGPSNVHRNEFGITKGTFWSPEGTKLAFYRMDESMVTDYPLVDIDNRIAKVVNTKYPMAGMASHEVTIGVYDLSKGKTIYLQTKDPFAEVTGEKSMSNDDYLTNVTWSPDEKYIYIAILNRDQNHMLLNKYDVVSGKLVKILFEEKNEKYVEPLNGPFFINSDPSKFIWQSQRDGFNHLYLYDDDGNLIKQITKGAWVVKDLLTADEKGNLIYFMANKDNPLDNQLYSVDLKGGDINQITPDLGSHSVKISGNGKYIIDNFSAMKVASHCNIIDTQGKTIETLIENKNPLQDYKLGETSVFPIKSKDNVDLWCRLIKPVGFNPSKKYPVIIYVYGGPHSQLVTDSWLGGGGLFLNYLATKGYVVFTLDNRGTSNRGLAFEQAIFRNLGTIEVDDQMKGVEYLKSLPWVDTTRIGINGWSYGGFMGMSMTLKHPGVFKTTVVGGPVIDWKYYEVMYGERYMDTPDANPDGYKNASLLNYTQYMKGKLLIIQGYQDGTVVPQNGLSFIKKCVDENIQVDYFIYPGHEHNVRGKDRVHLNQKIVNYFEDYLK